MLLAARGFLPDGAFLREPHFVISAQNRGAPSFLIVMPGFGVRRGFIFGLGQSGLDGCHAPFGLPRGSALGDLKAIDRRSSSREEPHKS